MKIYLLIANIVGLLLCFIDKEKSKRNKYRISENTLIYISLIGGCFGMYLGMHMFHHKTRKPKFIILIPAICIIWFIAIMEVIL